MPLSSYPNTQQSQQKPPRSLTSLAEKCLYGLEGYRKYETEWK